RACRWIWSGKLLIASAVARKPARISQRRPHRKQVRIAAHDLRRHSLNDARVVEDPDAAAVRRENQIVLTRMNEDVVYRDVRQVFQVQWKPFLTAVVRREQSELG